MSGATRFNLCWRLLAVVVLFQMGAGRSVALTTNVTLVSVTNLWRYEQSGVSLGNAWRGTNYDDSFWPKGLGLFYAGGGPNPKNTPLTPGPITFYFRGGFTLNAAPSLCVFQFIHYLDDGGVVYVNSNEVYRVGMPPGAINYGTLAARSVGTATSEGPTNVASGAFVFGGNQLAVEVHQTNGASATDVIFGLNVKATITYTNSPQIGLRINEVLASNRTLTNSSGFTPDWIEIHNPAVAPVNLADMSLSTDPAVPRMFVFPAGAVVGPLGHLLIECNGDLPASATNTGFALGASGGAILLFERPANGGVLADSMSYGIQAADFSLGRIPNGTGAFALTRPTPRAVNAAAQLSAATSLRINEWLAHSAGNGDWLEIFNGATNPVSISGLRLIRDPSGVPGSFTISGQSFIGTGPGAFVQFKADKGAGNDHLPYTLSAAGLTVALTQPDGVTVIDSVSFGPQPVIDQSEGRFRDGSTNIARFAAPSPGAANYLLLSNVVINEVLSHTDPPLEDAVELHNPTAVPADIGGWFLSNSTDAPRKCRLPSGTVVPANGFLVLYENQFNGTNAQPFTFNSSRGDAAFLFEAVGTGDLTGFRAEAVFGASANGVSFGRVVTGAGVDFVAQTARSFGRDDAVTLAQFRTGAGLPNAGPLIGPVIVNEIMYHPLEFGGTDDNILDEYIELLNVTCTAVPLFDPENTLNTWRLGSAVTFAFPTNSYIAGGDYVIVVPFNPVASPALLAAFRAKYAVPTNAPVFGPWTGKLSNLREQITLTRPDAPQLPPHPDAGLVPQIVVDSVAYSSLSPWPTNADGFGPALLRINPRAYGNEMTNWAAAFGQPGRDNALSPPTLVFSQAGRIANQWFAATVTGPCNSNYTIEASSAGTNWFPFVTNRAVVGQMTFSDTNAPGTARRFFRVRLGP
jgi:hypothetical protein